MAEETLYKVPWEGWRAVRKIDSGTYGSVYEIVRDLAGEPERCAMKVVSVPPRCGYDEATIGQFNREGLKAFYKKRAEACLKEYRIVEGLPANLNIVLSKDVKIVPRGDLAYDVCFRMELLTPLPKWKDLHGLSAMTAARIGRDIANALKACESRNVIHRDIKPNNILVDNDGNFKLGDFGVARVMEGTKVATIAGSKSYMAPEMMIYGRYDRTVDIYSLGLVMVWALNGGALPMNEGKLEGKPFTVPAACPKELRRIVLKACAFRPEMRYQSAKAMLHDLDAYIEAEDATQIPETETKTETMPRVPFGGYETPRRERDAEDIGAAWPGAHGEHPESKENTFAEHLREKAHRAADAVGQNARRAGSAAKEKAKEAGKAARGKAQEAAGAVRDKERAGVPESATGEHHGGITRRALVIGGAIAAGAGGVWLIRKAISSTANAFGSRTVTASASEAGIIALPVDGGGDNPWVSCDLSPVTTSRPSAFIGSYHHRAAMLRCQDGSTLAILDTEYKADEGVLEEVASWSDLRTVRFRDFDEGCEAFEPYALARQDDGTFLTTWDGLADAVSSDASGTWDKIDDFVLVHNGPEGSGSFYDIDAITNDGRRVELDVSVGSFKEIASGTTFSHGDRLPSVWTDKQASAFPANICEDDIILLKDETCWSIYGKGDTCGDAVRSWKDIAQCVETLQTFAAVDASGAVHATTRLSSGDDGYEESLQCVEEISGWSGIRKIDAFNNTYLGITSDGLLLGDLTNGSEGSLFKSYDLGLSNIADAALLYGWVVAIDTGGHVAAARIADLEQSLESEG